MPSLDAARALVEKAKRPVTSWPGPTTGPKAAEGKTIGFIACSQAAEGCRREGEGVKAAAEAIGWRAIILDGQGDQQKQLAAFNSLIDQHVDAVILGSIDAKVVGEAMARAQKANIKVISIMAPDPRPAGGLMDVEQDPRESGEVLAALFALDSNGKGNVALFNHNENPLVYQRNVGFQEGLKKYAPGMKIVVDQAVTLSQIGPPEQQLMDAVLRSHPKGTLDYVYAGFDAMLSPLIQSAIRAGRTELKAAAIDGNEENVNFIRSGTIQIGTIANPLEWDGWAAVDQLNRVFQGQPMVDQNIPYRLFTKDNLPAANKWEGDVDYKSYYKQIWGR